MKRFFILCDAGASFEGGWGPSLPPGKKKKRKKKKRKKRENKKEGNYELSPFTI